MHFLALLTRCKDEPFIDEFAFYYLNEGIDHIYIIDDNSSLQYSHALLRHPQITIYFEHDIIKRKIADYIYKKIRHNTQWLIYVDVDEYITTKKNQGLTIAQELKNSFSGVECIKVPWVMMSANGRKNNPKSLLKETVYRWNHNKKHINVNSPEHKFRCRYEAIEIKSIFRTNKFNQIWDHHPKEPIGNCYCVDGVYGQKATLNPFYPNLRENDINQAYFVCYHYRIISIENSLGKIKNNIWYKNFDIEDLMSTDYAEIHDDSMKNRVLQYHEN